MRVFTLIALAVSIVFSAHAEKRAFIVGVGDYDELSDLTKTIGDANGYETAFRDDLGFAVTKLENPNAETFLDGLDEFLASISPGDEVVFVFSGHGWSDGFDNYLALTDAPLESSERKLKKETVSLTTEVIGEIRARQPGFIFAVIDACRDNPFDLGTKSMTKGLVPQEIVPSTLIVFAAGDRQKALDRLGANDTSEYSVFTRALLPKLKDNSRSLMKAVDTARDEVSELAATIGHSQRPALYSDVGYGFCFDGECRGEVEDNSLAQILKNNTLSDFQKFKRDYPSSVNIDYVNFKIAQLSGGGAITKAMTKPAAGRYTLIPNAAISGHNKKMLENVSVADCKSACDAESWCQSFDYHKKTSICDLSDKSAAAVGGLKFTYPDNPFEHYGKADASGFVLIPNAAISGHNNRLLKNVGVDACKEACLADADCASFDYHKGHDRCDISFSSAESVGGLKFDYPDNPFEHYAKAQ